MVRDRIGILGGGIAGLACAYYLARSGYKTVVMEQSAQAGGLPPQVTHDGLQYDATPHSLVSTDTAVCGLLADLGALGRLTWRPARSGMLLGGSVYDMGSAVDTLRMSAMSLRERLRAAAAVVYATRVHGYTLHLNEERAVDWLPRVFGQTLYQRYWRRYLEIRFHDCADEVPAYMIWRELKRINALRDSVAGYIRGGPRWLAEKLRRSIEERGGEVRLNAQIGSVEYGPNGCTAEIDGAEQAFDAMISTLPPSLLAKLARGRLVRQATSALPHHSQVVALAISSRSLSRYGMTSVVDDSVPFNNIYEATRVIPARQSGGKHLIYLSRNYRPNSDGYEPPDDVVRKQVVESLAGCYRDFSPEHLEAVHVTRIEDAEPVFTVDNLRTRPKLRAPDGPFFFCTPTQAYPRPAGWDADITLSREVVGELRTL